MITLYRLLGVLLYPIIVIIIYLRRFFGKEDPKRFTEKIFPYKFNIVKNIPDLIWFHAASIGEFNSILPIVDNYLKKNQNNNFLITTITLSSYNEYKKRFGNNPRVFHQFLPYDLNFLVEHFLDSWRPNIVSFAFSIINSFKI